VRVTSGGQSGVDRAALDAAIELGVPYGGWCPAGGWAEDLPDPPGVLARYPELRQTPDADPRQRTEWNLRDADAVLVLTRRDAASPGTELAQELVRAKDVPHLVADLADPSAGERIADLLNSLDADATLTVGGPRESEAPGIYAQALELLRRALPSASPSA
jgi:hypothetical protein